MTLYDSFWREHRCRRSIRLNLILSRGNADSNKPAQGLIEILLCGRIQFMEQFYWVISSLFLQIAQIPMTPCKIPWEWLEAGGNRILLIMATGFVLEEEYASVSLRLLPSLMSRKMLEMDDSTVPVQDIQIHSDTEIIHAYTRCS